MGTSFSLSNDQKSALVEIISWYKKQPTPYFILGGFAGTGKTTLLGQFRKLLSKAQPKRKVAFCAYTGKAARVLEATLRYHQISTPQDSISTIHSLIYAPITSKGGAITGWKKKTKIYADLLLVDEASMVDQEIWSDLLSFQIPILAVGDHGQLPPISGQFNLMDKTDFRLESIHRQAADNPIIQLSLIARESGNIPIGSYGQGTMKVSTNDFNAQEIVEDILRSYNQDWLILTGYNHTRIRLNKQIRMFRDCESDLPIVGDVVICLKNNWDKGIFNGMQGTICSIHAVQNLETDETDWYQVEINLEDGSLYQGKVSSHQFNQPTTLTSYRNLSYTTLGDLFDFGYAVTVHKAQGSQSPKVLLFEEKNSHMNDEDWRRWLYTGITRAQERLVIVGRSN